MHTSYSFYLARYVLTHRFALHHSNAIFAFKLFFFSVFS